MFVVPSAHSIELAAYPKRCCAECVFPVGRLTVSFACALSLCMWTTSVFIDKRLNSFRETSGFLVYEK